MRNFMVVDVEADIYEQAPYNIGIVIGNQDNIIETKNIMMINHIKENRSARYAPENLSYFNLNKDEFLCYDADEDFAYDFYKMVQEYDIKELYAYNVKFDWRKLSKIMPEEKLKKILTPCDIMTAAFLKLWIRRNMLSSVNRMIIKQKRATPVQLLKQFTSSILEIKDIMKFIWDQQMHWTNMTYCAGLG